MPSETDIIEQLKVLSGLPSLSGTLAGEAAAEIQRLRGEVERLKTPCGTDLQSRMVAWLIKRADSDRGFAESGMTGPFDSLAAIGAATLYDRLCEELRRLISLEAACRAAGFLDEKGGVCDASLLGTYEECEPTAKPDGRRWASVCTWLNPGERIVHLFPPNPQNLSTTPQKSEVRLTDG